MVRGTCTARCDGLASPCSGARVSANQRCSDAGFRSHLSAAVARGVSVAPESGEDRRRRRDERSRKGDADYRRMKIAWGTVPTAMIEGLVVTVNRVACEAVMIREVSMKNRYSDD